MGDSIFKVFMDYWQIFLKGLRGTLLYAFIAVFFGTILGAFVAMAHMSRKKAVSGIAAAYVNVLRGTPLLVQMYISYYFVPIAIPALNKIDKVYFVVMALDGAEFALIADGERRGVEKPKRKRVKHLFVTEEPISGLQLRLEAGERVENHELRKWLSAYRQKEE